MKRRLIAIDGLDASGKMTQTELLKDLLAEKGVPYRYLSFPTYDADYSAHVNMYLKGRFGDDPESVNAFAASSFFGADRFCSYMLDWKKDYEEGAIVLANRYTSANAVHQLSKMPMEQYDEFLEWLMDYEYNKLGIPKPDAVIYLCVPPNVSQKMIQSRCDETGAEKDIHEKNKAHLENSYKAALYSAEKLGWIKIDCNVGDEMRSREDIQKEIIEKLKDIIPEIQ